MLHLLALIALRLLVVFMLIGVLLFHQWGWSEYASDSLYIVYYQMKPTPPYPFFIVNTDGRNESSELTGIAPLTTLDCSPDGRTLAFTTENARLYVVNNAGILYDRALDQGYTTLSVANNGMVALFRPGGGQRASRALLVDSTHALPLLPPDSSRYSAVELSSLGTVLWHRANYFGLEVTSLTGEAITSFPLVIFPKWLASEQLITFDDIASMPAQRVLVDTTARRSIRLSNAILNGVFSPDGTKRTVNMVEPGTSNIQIVISDPFSDEHMRQLTHTKGVIYSPVCFLTFRPAMLIASGQ